MYSLYCVRLEERTSLSDTNNTCLRPVNGTLEQPVSRHNAIAMDAIFFIRFLFLLFFDYKSTIYLPTLLRLPHFLRKKSRGLHNYSEYITIFASVFA